MWGYLHSYLFCSFQNKQYIFQALIRDSGNSVGKLAELLEVDKKDLNEALLTRVIAASGEVKITLFYRLKYLMSFCSNEGNEETAQPLCGRNKS